MTDGDPTTERGGPASWWKVTAIVAAVLVALTCGVIVWSFMPPVVYFPFFALAASVLLGLGGVWLILSLIGWMKYKTLRLSTIAPVIVLVTGALVTLSVPSRAAFALSKDSLEAVAADCQKSMDNQTIGVYRVLQVWPVGNGCRFHIEGGLIDSIGLAYLPDGAPYLGKPRRDGEIGYQEFDGDWYSFVQAF